MTQDEPNVANVITLSEKKRKKKHKAGVRHSFQNNTKGRKKGNNIKMLFILKSINNEGQM